MSGQVGSGELPSLGGSLAWSFLSLGLVCLIAYAALRWLARRSGAVSPQASGLRVIARLTLEPRRTVYVLQVARRGLLVGVGDGPMTVLAELDEQAMLAMEPAAAEARGFASVWAKVNPASTPSAVATNKLVSPPQKETP